jgi:hypothetical protein
MRIYRLQTENGVGPHHGQHTYGNRKTLNQLKYDYSHEMPDESERRQHPDADFGTDLCKAFSYKNTLIYKGSPYIFGFATIKDIYTWFCPAEIGWWEANGMYVYMYEVPDEHVIKGTRQVAFDHNYTTNKVKISHKELRHIKFVS